MVVLDLGLRTVGIPKGEVLRHWLEDAEHQPVNYELAKQRGDVVPFSPAPRPRTTWRPGLKFYMCYNGPRQPSMDEHGCVPVVINSRGIREREEVTYDKPPGQRRVLCVGDSFTFGWGIPVEKCWVRLLEGELAREGPWCTVNCGASGAIYIDEYCAAVQGAYHRYDPDIVVLTICLNDVALIPEALLFPRPPTQHWLRGVSAIADAAIGAWDARHRLELPPGLDYGRILLDLPATDPFYKVRGEERAVFWGDGTPQQALRGFRDWCRERRIALRLVIWPLLQGLGPGQHYPFATLHAVVREFCKQEGIELLDLLPVFAGRDPEQYWITPADLHANEAAQALAVPHIARFLVETGATRPR